MRSSKLDLEKSCQDSLKKIDKTLPTHNVEDQASLDALLNALKRGKDGT